MKTFINIIKKLRNGEVLSKLEERYWELYMYDAKVMLTILLLAKLTILILVILILRAL
jgi:hypothetical protein